MIWEFVGGIFVSAGILMVSILAHETGHMVAYKRILGHSPILKIEKRKWGIFFPGVDLQIDLPENITKKDRDVIILCGVGLGGVVLAVLSLSLMDVLNIYIGPIIILYIIGSLYDIKLLLKNE